MLSLSPEPAEEIRRFRAHPWPFQQTFLTPLKDLRRLVSTLLALAPVERCALATDQVVFEPTNLLKLMAKYSIPVANIWSIRSEAVGAECVSELLQAALGDWVDFCLVPTPARFAVYADHDEYVTFYASDESQVKMIASCLAKAGFSRVDNYVRPSSEGIWK